MLCSKFRFNLEKGSHINETISGRFRPLQRRSGQQNHYNGEEWLTIEVLVAVDQSMIENHGKHNLKEYALTLMSIASDRFCDLKIGYSIRLAVIDVIFIEKNLNFRYVRNNGGHEYFGRFLDKSIFD